MPTPRATEPPVPSGVTIRTLGGFAATVAGAPIQWGTWGGSRVRDLLKFVAAHHPQQIPRQQVLCALWGHLGPRAAANNLYKTLHLLRRVLDPSGHQPRDRWVHLQAGTLGLAPDIWVDSCVFTAHVKQAQWHEAAGNTAAAHREWLEAEQLWAGDFLAEDLHWQWVAEKRQSLTEQRFWVLEKLAGTAAAAGDHSGAGLYLKRILAGDATREAARRRLVESLYHAGRLREACAELQTARLQRLPETARELLRAASVSPRGIPLAVLEQLSSIPHADTVTALEVLLQVGILGEGRDGRIAFTDEIVRRTVFQGLSEARRPVRPRRPGCGKETRPGGQGCPPSARGPARRNRQILKSLRPGP